MGSGMVNGSVESERLEPCWHTVMTFQPIEFIDMTVFVMGEPSWSQVPILPAR